MIFCHTCEGMGGSGGFVDRVESILGGTLGLTRGRVMFCARVDRHGGWPSGLRCLGREQQEKPGRVFSLVALGPSAGVVAALTDIGILLISESDFGRFSRVVTVLAVEEFAIAVALAATAAVALAVAVALAAIAFGGGGGIIKDDISSDVRTLARFSSSLPLVCGGGGIVIVAKNDSRSRLIRFVLFLNPLSNTESNRNAIMVIQNMHI